MTTQERQLVQSALELLHRVIALDDAAKDFKPLLRLETNDVRPFPGNCAGDNFTQTTKTDAGEASEQEQGFVEFTNKEILQMPKQIRTIFRVNRQAAHVRHHRGVYEIRLQIRGYRITASAKRLDVAKERFIKKLQDFQQFGSTVIQNSRGYFLPYVNKWMETVKKPYIKENSYKMYEQLLSGYIEPNFAGRTMESLTQFELQEFINTFVNNGKYRTAQKVALLLSAVLDYAVDDGIISRNPMKRVRVARYEQERGQPLTREEEKLLISAFENCPTVYLQAYVFLLYTGIRRGELASVEIKNGWIHLTTGKQRKGVKQKQRRLPICPMLEKHLLQIDVTSIKALSPAMLTKHIKEFLPAHHCHDLRHTFITRAQECGIKREIVSLWAGHAADNSITSNVYTHLEQNEAHQIAEMSLFSYDLP